MAGSRLLPPSGPGARPAAPSRSPPSPRLLALALLSLTLAVTFAAPLCVVLRRSARLSPPSRHALSGPRLGAPLSCALGPSAPLPSVPPLRLAPSRSRRLPPGAHPVGAPRLPPSVTPQRFAPSPRHHADVLQALSSVECGYAALDSSACYVDAFGEPHPPFRPVGLPSFATQPPDPDDDDDPLVGGSPGPRADARPDARLRPLRCILPLAAYLDLPSTRYKCAQRTFSAVLHHAAWLRLLLSGSQRDCALLVSMSQRGAHDFHHAPLSDPRSHVPSAIFRLGLLYHLGLPIPGLGSADPLGDAAVCTARHSARHTAVLSAWHQAVLAAHTTACAIREPADHSAYSPGKRPDLYVTRLNLALDVKTASLFTSSASLASARLAAHTPVVAAAEPFYLKAFGDPRSGSSGEYSRAVGLGTTVNLLLTEVTGARHAHAERFLRLCTAAHAARFRFKRGFVKRNLTGFRGRIVERVEVVASGSRESGGFELVSGCVRKWWRPDAERG